MSFRLRVLRYLTFSLRFSRCVFLVSRCAVLSDFVKLQIGDVRMGENSSAASSGIPKLPFDLERDIFELAAKARPKEALTLVRVAHRVQEWCVSNE